MELREIKGVGDKIIENLNKLGIFSINGLMDFTPKCYWDMTRLASTEDVVEGNYILLSGVADNVSGLLNVRRGLNFFRCKFKTDDGKYFKAVWFNSPYIRKNLKSGEEYVVWGKVNKVEGSPELVNPSFELKSEGKRLMGVVPIYRTQGLIKQQTFRNIVDKAIEQFEIDSVLNLNESITEEIRTRLEEISDKDNKDKFLDNIDLKQAYIYAHKPQSVAQGYVGKSRIMKEELISSLIAYKVNKEGENLNSNHIYNMDKTVINEAINNLPYTLTYSQKKALDEIINSFRSNRKTNRMLQGDVGSGKTVVAFLAMLYAVKCGYQCAMMAPTEILTKQHYNNCVEMMSKLGINVGILTGSTKTAERREILAKLSSGEIDILLGTQSVINDAVVFKNLSFIVIDELHRFGVRQKSKLEDKTYGVDVLIMSATPIPRTLALVAFGDLQISYLESRKNEQTAVKTYIIGDEKLSGLYGFIRDRVALGEQAYIICPRVEDSEGIEMFSAKQLYNNIKSTHLADIGVGLVYGGMKDSAKDKVMQEFYNNEISVLIATTVIEVGIDSPRASVIAVLNSDNFGLATLHQLRGRVGRRDGLVAYCFLHSPNGDNERLNALKTYSDGADVAEIDGQIRGYGDFLGVRQSGGGDINQLKVTKESLMYCKTVADVLLEKDRQNILNIPKVQKLILETKNVSLS